MQDLGLAVSDYDVTSADVVVSGGLQRRGDGRLVGGSDEATDTGRWSRRKLVDVLVERENWSQVYHSSSSRLRTRASCWLSVPSADGLSVALGKCCRGADVAVERRRRRDVAVRRWCRNGSKRAGDVSR